MAVFQHYVLTLQSDSSESGCDWLIFDRGPRGWPHPVLKRLNRAGGAANVVDGGQAFGDAAGSGSVPVMQADV